MPQKHWRYEHHTGERSLECINRSLDESVQTTCAPVPTNGSSTIDPGRACQCSGGQTRIGNWRSSAPITRKGPHIAQRPQQKEMLKTTHRVNGGCSERVCAVGWGKDAAGVTGWTAGVRGPCWT